ncbi:MAG: TolC family protein [Bacteroidota bacterium]|nr:TolC family protein [Bacteroidota bacterium]
MERRLIAFVLIFAALAGSRLKAQETPQALSLSVDQAVEYALDHNRSVAAARYDLLASEKGVWEALAAGLPSIDASASLSYNLAIMTRIINFGGTPTAFKFGTNYDASVGASLSTVVFNAPWLVGVETAKMASTLARQGLAQTTLDTKENIRNVYFLILTLKESMKVVEGNLENLNAILASTKAMYSVGMAEATDVDQMQSTVTMLENSKSSMLRTLEVNYNMLRFLLGVPAGTVLTLTDSLDGITAQIDVDALLAEEFRIEDNISYQLIESQHAMSELALKSAKASTLPSLAGSIYYNRTGMGDELMHMQYFPYSAVAVQMQIPIFASGLRSAKINKAKINLEKSLNTKSMVSEQLLMQERQLRYNLLNANEQFRSQKANIEIAGRVLDSFRNKYNQGMASSLELTQANNNYLTAQNNYISAIMNLLQTKVAFDKLMNKL